MHLDICCMQWPAHCFAMDTFGKLAMYFCQNDVPCLRSHKRAAANRSAACWEPADCKVVTSLHIGAALTRVLLIPCTKCSSCCGIDEYAALAAVSVDGAACSCAADPRTAKTSLSFTSRRRDLLSTFRQVTRPLPTGVSPARTGSLAHACAENTICRIALSGLMRPGLLFIWSVTDYLSNGNCTASRLRNIFKGQTIERASAQDRGTVLCW